MKRSDRLKALLLLSCIMVLRPGKAGAGHDESKSIVIDGIERRYALYVPEARAGSDRIPLVIVLHGAFGIGGIIGDFTDMNDRAESMNFIAAYPESFGPYWNDGRDDAGSFAYRKRVDDVRFISRMIDAVSNEYPTDRGRVYAVGFSNGGMMAHRLAIEMPEKLAAVASVAGSLPRQLVSENPGNPVPIIMFHGTDDRTVPWKGGTLGKGSKKHGEVLSAMNTVLYWSLRNGCAGRPLFEVLPDTDPDDDTIVFRITYCAMRPDSEILFYSIKGGGHTWPGAKIKLPAEKVGSTSGDIHATDLILDFFLRHHRNARPVR